MGEIKTILLTGATGFLGSHLLKGIVDKGYCPVVLLRESSCKWRIQYLQNQYIPYVINDDIEATVEKLFAKYQFDAIVHTATDYGRDTTLAALLQTNVIFPVCLIEAGLKTNLKLFINTDTFFGKKQFNQSYLSNYTSSKRILEELLKGMGTKLTIANLRIEHVYGENDAETKFITNVYKRLLQNQHVIEFTEGTQKRDLIYVEDVVDAYMAIIDNAEKLTGFEEFEVGTGNSISIKHFVCRMAKLLESKSTLDFGALPNRDGEIEDSVADISKLIRFGWYPRHTMDEAIKKMELNDRKRFIR